jgi:hypothetical protein
VGRGCEQSSLEAKEMFEAILRRFERLEIDGDAGTIPRFTRQSSTGLPTSR